MAKRRKLEIPRWGPFSGYISWTNERGNGYFPATGGLFLGDDAAQAIQQTSGVFPVSQEERNAVRTRFRYDVTARFWLALAALTIAACPSISVEPKRKPPPRATPRTFSIA